MKVVLRQESRFEPLFVSDNGAANRPGDPELIKGSSLVFEQTILGHPERGVQVCPGIAGIIAGKSIAAWRYSE